MGRAFLVGWMEGDMKVNMKMIKNMVRESLSGQMGVNMMDSGKLSIIYYHCSYCMLLNRRVCKLS